MLAFAWAAHVHLPLWLPAVLALAAWSIYIGDRLLDAHKAQTPLRPRHHFHWEHRRIFTPLALTAAVAAISIVFCAMPVAARERNSALAVAALAYFTSVHSPWRLPGRKTQHRLPKELLVGILFTLACATPTLARVNWGFNLPRVLCVLLALFGYIALAWLNCYAIECWNPTLFPKNRRYFISQPPSQQPPCSQQPSRSPLISSARRQSLWPQLSLRRCWHSSTGTNSV
jgi:hypothetical protein